MSKYIIIHGSFSSSNSNWFQWLKHKLQEKNLEVYVPQMPVGVGKQNFESWSKALDELEIDQDTIIIAHSIAPVFVCKYLIKNNIKVKKLIFICGFNKFSINADYDAVNRPMYIDDLENIKKYCGNIVCFYSDNDPYVSYAAEKQFADAVANKQIVVKNGGHINSESGFNKFEEILEQIF